MGGAKSVFKWAIISRLLLFCIALGFSLFPDFDSSQENLLSRSAPLPLKPADALVDKLLGHFERWDGVYFAMIAKEGYKYEQFNAFFPLYPFIISWFSYGLRVLFGDILMIESYILIAGFLLSNICFVLAALVLYKMSQLVLKDDKLAERAALLFCFNPASIFMSALYTESLFALFSFLGMWALEAFGEPGMSLAALAFMVSSAVRSNGAVSCGFLLFCAASKFIPVTDILLGEINPFKWLGSVFPQQVSVRGIIRVVATGGWTVALCTLVCFPVLGLQLFGRKIWCSEGALVQQSPYSEWCNEPLLFSFIPNFYGHIQSAYWGQGFLHYWQMKQLPNFVLYAPMFILVMHGTITYFVGSSRLALGKRALVYVVHAAFLAIFVLFCMHVQVGTRFLSAYSPIVFWYAARLSFSSKASASFVYSYFASFFLIGILLFTNFYPWT